MGKRRQHREREIKRNRAARRADHRAVELERFIGSHIKNPKPAILVDPDIETVTPVYFTTEPESDVIKALRAFTSQMLARGVTIPKSYDAIEPSGNDAIDAMQSTRWVTRSVSCLALLGRVTGYPHLWSNSEV